MISNSGKDENGKYSGGKAGDQTGHEWEIRTWYNRPWNCVLRYSDPTVGEDIALLATHAALNDLIGYDQGERLTFWNALSKAKDYDPANITEACEDDCSSGVSGIAKAVGYRKGIKALQDIPAYLTTWGMRDAFRKAGFEVLTDSKYLMSDAYLRPGDVLLNDSAHTAINVGSGALASSPSSNGVSQVTVGGEKVYYFGHVQRGKTGTAVKMLQAALNIRANAGLEVDGSCGPKTVAAIKNWQATHGLVVDGSCGPATWTSILAA